MANWRKYIFDNDDEAAAQIMLAANYGGRAINITQTTAPHAMSYKITSMYGLPHGHAVAVCLPEVWQYMTNHLDDVKDARGSRYLEKTFSEIALAMGYDKIRVAIAQFRQMMYDMRISYPEAGNMEDDLCILSESVNPVRLKNNPVQIDKTIARILYSSILQKK